MELSIRAFMLPNTDCGRVLCYREFKIDKDLVRLVCNNSRFLREIARNCGLHFEDINLFWKDTEENFVPCYENDNLIESIKTTEKNSLEIYVQMMSDLISYEKESSVNFPWNRKPSAMESKKEKEFGDFLWKLSNSRLLHRTSRFDDCPLFLMKDFKINERKARDIFEECKVHFYDTKNKQHILGLPKLMDNFKRMAIIFNTNFKDILMKKTTGVGLMLPKLDLNAGDARVDCVEGLINNFSRVSFLDVRVGRSDNAGTAVDEINIRAYFIFGVDVKRSKNSKDSMEWKPLKEIAMNEVAINDRIVDLESVRILTKVSKFLENPQQCIL